MPTSIRLSCVLLGLVLSVAAGCGDDGGNLKAACEKGCATVAPLNCPKENAATCVSDCEAAANTIPSCKSQGEALIICTGNQPASNFSCDSDGEAQLKDGVCEAEGNAFLMCALGGS